MAYRFRRKQSVRKNVARIATEQIDEAISELADGSMDPHEAVHQVRKHYKKIRALLRLVRPALGDIFAAENAWFRNAGRELSRVRDAQSAIETYDALMEHFAGQVDVSAFGSVRHRLTERKKQIADEQMPLSEQLDALASDLTEARGRVKKWVLEVNGFKAVSGGLGKTYSRARRALAGAYEQMTPEVFHEWRKRAKAHWYQVRLICPARPKVLKARRDNAKRLAEILGNEHDLSMFRDLLAEDRDSFGTARNVDAMWELVNRRQAELRDEARPLGKQLFAKKPKAFLRQIADCWKAWQKK